MRQHEQSSRAPDRDRRGRRALVRAWLATLAVGLAGVHTASVAQTDWQPRRQLHLSVYSFHLAKKEEVNEWILGTGITWDLKRVDVRWLGLSDVVIAFEGDVFKDSEYEWALAGGVSVRKTFGALEAGVLAGLTRKDNLRRDSDLPLFPYALPFVQTNFGHRVNLRAVWIPPVRKATDNQIALHLLLDF